MVKRFTLINDHEITLDIEHTDTACFLHIHTIKVFNKSVLKRLAKLSDDLAEWLVPQYGALYTYADENRRDLQRLAVHMKFMQDSKEDNLIVYRRQ